MNLYDNIEDPIEDESVIKQLIRAYSKSATEWGGFYGQLVKTVDKQYHRGEHYREDSDKFYATAFNKWKNNIVNMTRDEFIELYRQGSYGADFPKMREYLKKVPDVRTKQEADDIFYSNKVDKELKEALDKYRWTAFGELSGWVHVCSRYLTAKKDPYQNVEHRLYLDTESIDTYKLINLFMEKCDRYKLLYYFKFDEYGNRDDSMVIYSSTENLPKYISILQEIKKENPELISRTKQPPILTGKIDGWIGYGSEPQPGPDGKPRSFNSVRSKLIETALSQVTREWIKNACNLTISLQGQNMLFRDYVALFCAEDFMNELQSSFNYYKKTYGHNEAVKQLGYSENDLKSQTFIQNIRKGFKQIIDKSLYQVCSSESVKIPDLIFNLKNGSKKCFNDNNFRNVLKKLSVIIDNNNPKFVNIIQDRIRSLAPSYGVDSNKFCFDIDAIKKVKTLNIQESNIPKEQSESNVIIDIESDEQFRYIESELKKAIEANDEVAINYWKPLYESGLNNRYGRHL